MTNIKITEGRSVGCLRGFNNLVRVFIKNDYSYGYWMDENRLYDLFNEDQKENYLNISTVWEFVVSENVAQIIKNEGFSPFNKPSIIGLVIN